MSETPTICSFCDHPHPATRDEEAPWKWRCLKVPTRPGFRFVSITYSPDPPFARCQDVNKYGDCEHYEPKRVMPEGYEKPKSYR